MRKEAARELKEMREREEKNARQMKENADQIDDTVIEDYEHGIFTEVDTFLENGDKVMIVEIKNKPLTEHIQEHIKRMEKLRAYADLRNDYRQYLGAIAGVVMTKNVKDYAFKSGFYVIELSGDTFNISPPKGEYKPKAW